MYTGWYNRLANIGMVDSRSQTETREVFFDANNKLRILTIWAVLRVTFIIFKLEAFHVHERVD